MSHVAVHHVKPRLASWLLALGMLAAAGCSEPAVPSYSQLADDPNTPPEFKAILASDKSDLEKHKLIREKLRGTSPDGPMAKSGSKAKRTKKSPQSS